MSAQTIAQLKALSLHGMAASFTEVAARARHTELNPESFMQQLIDGKSAHWVVRSTAYQMGAARFPAHRDLAGFEFEQAGVDEALVRRLHSTEFTGAAHNAVLIGGPGTGKTHLATAIGVQAIQKHAKRVRFFSTVELVNALEQAKTHGKAGQIALKLMYVDLVILDELGYLPFSQAGGALLFHLLSSTNAPVCSSLPIWGLPSGGKCLVM
jgi:DNA replication protein DnaC